MCDCPGDTLAASTESVVRKVDYLRRSRQMVRDLESFLGSELARPREGRRIYFLSVRRNASVDPLLLQNPAEE
jgi:hypothetical protein